MEEQNWLTLDMLSAKLRLPVGYIKELTKQGALVSIGKLDQTRYLDPTPEYATKLRIAAIAYGKLKYVPPDISELNLLTIREISAITGWTMRGTQLYFIRHPDVPRIVVNAKLHLYTVKTVRDILWKRQGRKFNKQRSPFLITRMIEFFWKMHNEETALIPTDEEFYTDDIIQRKLEALVRRHDKDLEDGKKDFASKVELARKIVQILESAKPQQAPDHSACDAQSECCSPPPAEAQHPQ